MNRHNWPSPVAALAATLCAVCIASLASVGCDYDIEPADDFAIEVEPQTVRLKEGQSQTFTASGGLTYRWELSETTSTQRWGILSANVGRSVTYTSVHAPVATTNIHVIRASSILSEGGDTNTASTTASAEAYIFLVP